jgi:flagellar hook-length control protein FliK
VARAFPPAPLRDDTRIRLALHPAHLGELVLELSAGRLGVRARLRTDTEAARDLILAHLDDLRRDLERRGIRIRRFDVELAAGNRKETESGPDSAGPRSHRRQVLDLDA